MLMSIDNVDGAPEGWLHPLEKVVVQGGRYPHPLSSSAVAQTLLYASSPGNRVVQLHTVLETNPSGADAVVCKASFLGDQCGKVPSMLDIVSKPNASFV